MFKIILFRLICRIVSFIGYIIRYIVSVEVI